MEVKTPKEIRDFHSSGQRVYFAEEMKQRISFFLSDKLFGKNLDIGGGRYSYYPNSTVVDLSPVALEYNQSKEKLEFDMDSIANGNKLPFPDNSFDHATMVSVFQYIKHRKKATQELMRVLKPGAEIYIINCRGGLSECIQNSYHSSDIQKLFEKEGFTTMIENIPFRSDIEYFQSVCVAMPEVNLFGHMKGSIRNKNERILQNKIYSNYKPRSRRIMFGDDWDDETKNIDVFTNAYFAQEIRKVNDLFYKIANHPITAYSLKYKQNIEAFTQECLAKTNAIPIITSYIGNNIAMNMLIPGEESHILLHILGKEKNVSKEDEDNVIKIAKRFNLNTSGCYGHFRSAKTPEDIATFYENRHNETTYDNFYGEYREGILTEDEKYTLISTLAEIPLNSSTKSLQELLYPIAKGWFTNIDDLIFQERVRSYYGLLYNYKQRRIGEKLLKIKDLCKQGKIDIIGWEKIDYLPIIQKFPAILAKHDQDAFRGSKAICED